jgi:hypothetical protein
MITRIEHSEFMAQPNGSFHVARQKTKIAICSLLKKSDGFLCIAFFILWILKGSIELWELKAISDTLQRLELEQDSNASNSW